MRRRFFPGFPERAPIDLERSHFHRWREAQAQQTEPNGPSPTVQVQRLARALVGVRGDVPDTSGGAPGDRIVHAIVVGRRLAECISGKGACSKTVSCAGSGDGYRLVNGASMQIPSKSEKSRWQPHLRV